MYLLNIQKNTVVNRTFEMELHKITDINMLKIASLKFMRIMI